MNLYSKSKWRLESSLRGLTFVFVVLLGTQSATAQTYLDRLENIVKQFRQDQTPADPATEELPIPQNPATQNPATRTVPTPALQPEGDSERGSIYLGLEAEDVTGGGLGVAVTKVTDKSPAWKAGFEVGDRILAVNNFSIAGLDQMADQLFKLAPGDTCQFLVTRGARNIKLTAVLLDAALASKTLGGASPTAAQMSPPESDGKAWVGLLVNDLTAAFRAQFGQRVSRGAAVTNVTRSSPAWEAGIRAGDCITEFAQRPISGAEDMIGMLNVLKPGQVVEAIYYRGVIRRTAMLTLTTQPGTDDPRTAPRRAPRVPVNPNLETRPEIPAQQPTLLDPSQPNGQPQMELPPFLLPSDRGDAGIAQGPAEPPASAGPPLENGSEDARVAELERTVEKLKRELAEKSKQIDDMQQRLRGILQSLGGR